MQQQFIESMLNGFYNCTPSIKPPTDFAHAWFILEWIVDFITYNWICAIDIQMTNTCFLLKKKYHKWLINITISSAETMQQQFIESVLNGFYSCTLSIKPPTDFAHVWFMLEWIVDFSKSRTMRPGNDWTFHWMVQCKISILFTAALAKGQRR